MYLQYIVEHRHHPNVNKSSYRGLLIIVLAIGSIYGIVKATLEPQTSLPLVVIMGLSVRGLIVPLILFRNNDNFKNFVRNGFKSVPIIPK